MAGSTGSTSSLSRIGTEADLLRGARRVIINCVGPFGQLRLATWFREHGCEVQWLDRVRDPSPRRSTCARRADGGVTGGLERREEGPDR
ncbi:MAG: hypothetical protein WCJ30_05495 [Deltaproteobacteria bacterium]